MTRTISLIIGIALVALAAVPTAVATPSPREQVDAVKFFYANERATVPLPAAVHDHGNATEARLLLKSPTIGIVRDNGDATQAKLVQSLTIGTVRDDGDATQAKLAWLSGPVVVGEDALRSLGRPDRVTAQTAASHYTPQDVQRMSDSYAARGGDLTNVPSSSYYLPQQIEAMSQGWAARGGTGSETVRLSGDGRHIEWSQIGIGFGIGMLLAIGLGLSLRATRPRTLAH